MKTTNLRSMSHFLLCTKSYGICERIQAMSLITQVSDHALAVGSSIYFEYSSSFSNPLNSVASPSMSILFGRLSAIGSAATLFLIVFSTTDLSLSSRAMNPHSESTMGSCRARCIASQTSPTVIGAFESMSIVHGKDLEMSRIRLVGLMNTWEGRWA